MLEKNIITDLHPVIFGSFKKLTKLLLETEKYYNLSY